MWLPPPKKNNFRRVASICYPIHQKKDLTSAWTAKSRTSHQLSLSETHHLGGSINGVPPNGWFMSWKIPSINGWDLGVPLWLRKHPNNPIPHSYEKHPHHAHGPFFMWKFHEFPSFSQGPFKIQAPHLRSGNFHRASPRGRAPGRRNTSPQAAARPARRRSPRGVEGHRERGERRLCPGPWGGKVISGSIFFLPKMSILRILKTCSNCGFHEELDSPWFKICCSWINVNQTESTTCFFCWDMKDVYLHVLLRMKLFSYPSTNGWINTNWDWGFESNPKLW